MGTSRHQPPKTRGGSISAAVLGIVVFLVGVGLLAFTFNLAYSMFAAPVEQAVGADGKTTLDLAKAGQSLIGVLTRILMLIVMGLLGSLIANRGISLFAGTISRPNPPSNSTPASDIREPRESLTAQTDPGPK